MLISPGGFSSVLKTLAVLSDQGGRVALLVAGRFFFNCWRAGEVVERGR